MPVYEFRCPECGKDTTSSRPDLSGSDGEPPFYCAGQWDGAPAHGLIPFKRIYGFSGAILKGSGFYKTDKDK